MKTHPSINLIALLGIAAGFALGVQSTWAQGTAFGYQGRLDSNGTPATGLYDLRFAIYDTTNPPGILIAGPQTNSATGVTNGLFEVTLDFGSGVFTGPPRWMEIGVRTNGSGGFTNLGRVDLLPTPYAIFAATASNLVAGSVVKSLTVGANTLQDNVTLLPGANITLTPNGNTLLIDSAGGGGGSVWSVLNNSAYYNQGGVGIGTSTPKGALQLASGGLAVTGASSPYNGAGAGVFLESSFAGGAVFAYDYSSLTPRPLLLNSPGGKVGIGTLTPGAALDVFGNWDGDNGALTLKGDQSSLRFKGSFLSGNKSWLMQLGSDGPGNLEFFTRDDLGFPPNWQNVMTMTPDGHVGINTTIPLNHRLEVVGQNALGLIGYQPYMTFSDDNAGYARSRVQGVGGDIVLETEAYITSANPSAGTLVVKSGSGNVGIGTGTPQAKLDVAGTTRTCVLTITGGCDIAEPFPVDSAEARPGSVLVIDASHPGRLRISSEPYDTRVAGVVSGANGIHPGLSLRQEGALDTGENVALTGRVYVQADATFSPIKPGDLLTTSATPGHAMKVRDQARAQGAVLGKAMSSLQDGKGMVLVLVTLQ